MISQMATLLLAAVLVEGTTHTSLTVTLSSGVNCGKTIYVQPVQTTGNANITLSGGWYDKLSAPDAESLTYPVVDHWSGTIYFYYLKANLDKYLQYPNLIGQVRINYEARSYSGSYVGGPTAHTPTATVRMNSQTEPWVPWITVC